MNLPFLLASVNFQWLKIVQLYLKLQRIRGSKVRRWWVKPHLREIEREVYGAYQSIFLRFMESDHEEFSKMVRMTPNDFQELFQVIGHHLLKASLRRPLPPGLRLALTLNYLAHGDSIFTSGNYFRIGRSTMYSIIREVCPIIWNVLSPLVLRRRTEIDYQVIAGGFRAKWQLPNCVGAMDGKEIRISAPPNSGSLFYNYKCFFSIKVLAVCDAFYRFIWCDIGDYGSVSDLSTFRQTGLYECLERGDANLPPNSPLPRSNILMPYYFIGDEIFTLQMYMMVPYARRRALNRREQNFNYRLSRGRNCIEDAFGIMVSKWAILKKRLDFKLSVSIDIVRAIVCLHNFRITKKLERGENIDDDIRDAAEETSDVEDLRVDEDNDDDGDDDADDDGDDDQFEANMNDVENVQDNPDLQVPLIARTVRDILANYFEP